MVVVGFKLRALCLLQALYHLSYTASLFTLHILPIGSHICTQAGLDHGPLIHAFPLSWDARHTLPHSIFYWLIWGLSNFLSGMALNHDPPDLHLPPLLSFFLFFF
jgi:hypothetical protein